MKQISPSSGFSIVLALGLTILLSVSGLFLIEYIVPFSRNVKGVENATSSFYQAYSGIEEALFIHSNRPIGYNTGKTFGPESQTFSNQIIGRGLFTPRQFVGEGTSDYDKNYNKISQSEPAQFVIGKGRMNAAPRSLTLSLRVPNIHPSLVDALNTTVNDPIVQWQLSSTGESLSAGAPFTESQINATFTGDLLETSVTGTLLDGTASNFQNFYDTYCSGTTQECVLKVTVINPMINTISGAPKIPYLEYKLRSDPNIPRRYAVITSQGKSYDFSKILKIQMPQTTTNAAFDFTVFQ